jgi:hypothetical protein
MWPMSFAPKCCWWIFNDKENIVIFVSELYGLAEMSLKAKDLKYEEAALRKRLEYVQTLKQALSQEDSIFTTTVEAYTSCIDGMTSSFWFKAVSRHVVMESELARLFLAEIIEEIALEVHRAVKTGMVRFYSFSHNRMGSSDSLCNPSAQWESGGTLPFGTLITRRSYPSDYFSRYRTD